MALASLVLRCNSERLKSLTNSLQSFNSILQIESVEPASLAVVLECSAQQLPCELKKLQNLDDVWNLELIYVNYEEDFGEDGRIDYTLPKDFFNKNGAM